METIEILILILAASNIILFYLVSRPFNPHQRTKRSNSRIQEKPNIKLSTEKMKKIIFLIAFLTTAISSAQALSNYQRHGQLTSAEINAIDTTKVLTYTADNTTLGIEVINRRDGNGWVPRIDGTETSITNGTNTTVTGDGSIGSPYQIGISNAVISSAFLTVNPNTDLDGTNDIIRGINAPISSTFRVSNDFGGISVGTNNQIEIGDSPLSISVYGETEVDAENHFAQIYVENYNIGSKASSVTVKPNEVSIKSEGTTTISANNDLGIPAVSFVFDSIYNSDNDVARKANVDAALDNQTLAEVLANGNIMSANIFPDIDIARSLGNITYNLASIYNRTYIYKPYSSSDPIFTTNLGQSFYRSDLGKISYWNGSNIQRLATESQLATAGTDDQTASEVSFTPNGSIAADNVQLAIQEVRDEAVGTGITTEQANRITNENYFSFRNSLSETPTDVAFENTTSGNEGKKVLNYADASEDLTITLDGSHVEGKSYTYFTKTATSQITIAPADATISDALILNGATGTENTITLSTKGQSATVIKTDVANEYFVTGDGTLSTTTFASALLPASADIAELEFWINAEEQTGIDGSAITSITDQSANAITVVNTNVLNEVGVDGERAFTWEGATAGANLNLGNPAALNFLQADSWTIMFTTGDKYPIGAVYADGYNGNSQAYIIPSNSVEGGAYTAGYGAGGFLTTPQPPWEPTGTADVNQDFTYFFTKNGSSFTFRVFEKGDATATYVSTGTVTASFNVTDTTPILIGQIFETAGASSFKAADAQTGSIRQFGIWSKVLSSAESDAIRLEIGL